MKRRRMLHWTAAAGLPSIAPRLSRAQAPAPRRIGVLAPSTAAREAVTLKPFFDEMEHLGWVEGRQVVYDRAYADDRMEDLPQRAAELVARRPELIYAPPQPAAVAARRATATIPIVFATATDPVGAGLVASLARPGGNATAIGQFDSLAPKSLQLLREMLPRVRRVPAVGHRGEMAEAGALLSYGPSLAGQIRASAQFVDKVLRGANPAELPVQQPTTVELVINMRTASVLGITVPLTLLLRAERVIE